MISLPRDDLEKVRILTIIAAKFEMDKHYSEAEVNRIIRSCDVDDYALFRRELLNFGFFGKDSYKNQYWLKTHKLSEEQIKAIGVTQDKLKDMD